MLSAFGEHPASGSPAWRPESLHRGSWTILITCLTTMLLCIWTAIHLNIPQQKRAIKNLFRKVLWVLIGMLAPELIVWSAFQQRKDAKKLTKRVRKILGQPESPSTWESLKNKFHEVVAAPEIWWMESKNGAVSDSQRAHPEWTDVQSYYVLMGGYVLADSQDYLSIKPKGVELLLRSEDHHIPVLSSQEVLDKSKANGLAKLLVCIQAGWFCMQCLGRLATGLPICLLELNTFAHAICAILIYIFWWDKPFEVEQPTFVESNAMSAVRPLSYLVNPEGKQRRMGRHLPKAGYGQRRILTVNFRLVEESARPIGLVGIRIIDPSMSASGNTRIEFHIQGYETNNGFIKTSEPKVVQFRGFWIQVSESDSFLELTQQDLDELDAVRDYVHRFGRDDIDGSFGFGVASNWPGWASANPGGIFCAPLEFGAASMLVGFSIAGVLYGAIHLLAWDAPFRSSLEQTLWRVSGCILASSGFFIPFIDFSSGMINDSNDSIIARIGCGALRPFFYIIFILVCMPVAGGFMISYVLARVFLFVECFRSLTYLPDSVFVVPNWSTYIPHFG